jgi:hypothetical protein
MEVYENKLDSTVRCEARRAEGDPRLYEMRFSDSDPRLTIMHARDFVKTYRRVRDREDRD